MTRVLPWNENTEENMPENEVQRRNFLKGGAAFPQNPGYNPTGTVAALAYTCADAIRERYVKAPGPLA